jgi:hypothetical protein
MKNTVKKSNMKKMEEMDGEYLQLRKRREEK